MISAEYVTARYVCFLVGYLTSLQDLKKGTNAQKHKRKSNLVLRWYLCYFYNDPSTNVLCNAWYLLAGLPHSD